MNMELNLIIKVATFFVVFMLNKYARESNLQTFNTKLLAF